MMEAVFAVTPSETIKSVPLLPTRAVIDANFAMAMQDEADRRLEEPQP